ncbi:hypothetical protein M569_08675 [Genlisea aurea]|uniref:Leucine-rich repeat-containing N-terminal plant-type domain-containing protein n=1 Tax=Genlisea aurea TaxID=192259 RepID=S8E1C5_9LAMI|nr:hypothetical protein M569_08675 [Genlisea aurea]
MANLFLSTIFSVLVLSLLLPLNGAQRCNPEDKKALLHIKASLGNPASLSSWNNSATDCCTWLGISCNTTTNRVITFDLSDAPDMVGKPIPSAISELPFLQWLRLYNLNLTGPIPASFTKLKIDSLDPSLKSLSKYRA